MLKKLGYERLGQIWLNGVGESLSSLEAVGLKLFQITMMVNIAPGQDEKRFR
ncbi:MAG: hypothetical protein H5U07_00315 [Candidatus Aminicenantes bacterium]|nr:hypothetical protein [Candidatus Aminicenantes bacterium]